MAVNLHEKQHWASSKFYWFIWKKCRSTGWTSRCTEYGKVKNNIEPHQNFIGSYEKSVKVLDELQNFKIHRISKGRKVNKLWRKLFDQH